MTHAETIALVTSMLPDHYTITDGKQEKSNWIRCRSDIGIANNDGNEDTEQWGYFMDALRTKLGERFMEVDHNTCHNHVDFVVYIRKDIALKESALREVRKLNDILNTHGNVLVPNLEGNTQTSAIERAVHFLEILKDEFGIDSDEKLWEEIMALEEKYPSK